MRPPCLPTPDRVIVTVCELSGIPLETLASPAQLRRVCAVRSAAAHLLRVDLGLSREETGRLIGRSDQIVSDLTTRARAALESGGPMAELIARARQLLACTAILEPAIPVLDGAKSPDAPAEPAPEPSRLRRRPVPGLMHW